MGYVTLGAIKDLLEIGQSDTADDTMIQQIIDEATGYVDAWCHRHFDVRIESRAFPAPNASILVIDDVLDITSVRAFGEAVGAGNYRMGRQRGEPCFSLLRRIDADADPPAPVSWTTGFPDYMTADAIEIVGVWGYDGAEPNPPESTDWADAIPVAIIDVTTRIVLRIWKQRDIKYLRHADNTAIGAQQGPVGIVSEEARTLAERYVRPPTPQIVAQR